MKLIAKENGVDLKATYTRDFLIELLVCRHGKRDSQLQELNEMPLYPSEDVIWDENIVPGMYFNKLRCPLRYIERLVNIHFSHSKLVGA